MEPWHDWDWYSLWEANTSFDEIALIGSVSVSQKCGLIMDLLLDPKQNVEFLSMFMSNIYLK